MLSLVLLLSKSFPGAVRSPSISWASSSLYTDIPAQPLWAILRDHPQVNDGHLRSGGMLEPSARPKGVVVVSFCRERPLTQSGRFGETSLEGVARPRAGRNGHCSLFVVLRVWPMVFSSVFPFGHCRVLAPVGCCSLGQGAGEMLKTRAGRIPAGPAPMTTAEPVGARRAVYHLGLRDHLNSHPEKNCFFLSLEARTFMGHKVHPWLQLAHTKPMFRPGLSRNYGCFLALTKAGDSCSCPLRETPLMIWFRWVDSLKS